MKQLFFVLTFLSISLGLNAQKGWRTEDGKVILSTPVQFKGEGSELTDDSKKSLAAIVNYLNEKDYITKLRIEGHFASDLHGSENMLISNQRAMAVAKHLVSKGVDCKRLIAVGFGDSMPIVAEDDENAYEQNTRIEFVNAELNKIAIGGMPIDGGGNVAGDACK